MTKIRNNVGYHNRGEPYPEHDFSGLNELNLSWVSSAVCLSNEDIAKCLEKQYTNAKISKGQYFYYTLFEEDTENTCQLD